MTPHCVRCRKVFSMSSGMRDLGEDLESCSESFVLRESGALAVKRG
jgi:hypothetical protein